MKKQNKWLDNFGKADNANESNVSLSENFNGLAYDTSYRDYSPAWGGQFQDGGYVPIAQTGITQQDVTRVDNNAADRIWGIQRELDAEKLSRDAFKEKYEIPLHQFKMRDSNYASAFQRQLEQRRQQDPNYAEVNLPSTDIRSSIYQGNPNLAFLPGTSKGQSRAALEDAFLATTTLSAPLLPVNTAKIGQFSKIVGDYLTTQTPLKNIYKLKFPGLNKNSEDFFSKYLTPKEAAVARAERMLAQEPKWQVNNNSYTRDKFENINNNFEEVYAHEVGQSPKSLGINMEGKSLVFKDSGLSPANQARVAAHETGHFYRNMADEANEWNSFFDFSNLKQSTRRYLRGKSEAKPNIKTQSEGFGFEKGPPHGDEIRERAAQLKDYIAQKNRIPLNKDFTITEKQLNDAIKNYVKDTGLDNTMTEMLNSLKDKKGFLRAMNKYALGVTPATVIGAGATQLENEEQSEQFQQGGSIPGTVGFTYARTGSTPSEGKYAKKTLPSALNGKEMKFYQEGLDWKPKSMRDGGITKDNQGYWNPDNWGKPVEIDSNEITMKPNPYTGVGVPYDVLAFSDEGDVQYMEPGKDYKFKGSKVTEIPMAKLGINQLDAQPMKKLNQLLNFTNNPDKTNWLDKYQ